MIFERTILSDLSMLDGLTADVQAFLAAHVEDDDLAFRAALVTSEAVMNAIEHGNALDATRQTHVRLDADRPGRIVVSVADEGEGFDPGALPDPLRSDALLAEGGRGVFLMRELSDDLTFSDGGRRVVLTLSSRP